ncbi:helix-turn-helix transcriptional regulator, partial [Bacteroidales bacterium OttesenSCG-928-L03]|nr:helix-turn-helix transcriptional regulator [Bacteroidales bacterium OttesenSCG-928-L03]
MKKRTLPINLQCMEHPQDCSFHLSEHRAGNIIKKRDREKNCLVFFRKGRARLFGDLVESTDFEAGDILFYPRLAEGHLEILEDCSYAAHQFDHSSCCSLHCILSPAYVYKHHANHKHSYNCKIRAVAAFEPYLESIATYLNDGISNPSLWYAKHQEAIRLFSLYYNMEQLCSFLQPLLFESLPFKSTVISNAQLANSAEELAELCGYGISAFRRRFKDYFGMPAAQWLQQERAKKVNYALTATDMPIKEIIDALSFSSPSHFNTFCKRIFNNTPTEIR